MVKRGVRRKEAETSTLVLVLCVIGYVAIVLGILGSIILLVTPVNEFFGPVPVWYSIIALIINVAAGFLLAYIFKMKRWALFAFTGLFIVEEIISFAAGIGNYYGLIAYIIFIALFYIDYKKMR